jgi:hypothetical protein
MGVGVGGPYLLYVRSIDARISSNGVPACFIAITPRVMSKQISHPAAWLVKVIRPSGNRSAT